jgi:hypothetical protein
MGYRVAWGWNDCSKWSGYQCPVKPQGPGPAWTDGDREERRRVQERERERNRRRAERACFVAGTLVHTKDGLIAIERIAPGDEVLSWNPETRRFEYHVVTDVVTSRRTDLVTLAGPGWSLTCSSNHRFLTSDSQWQQAAKLGGGDHLKAIHEPAQALFERLDVTVSQGVPVFNLEVETTHTYCVTKAGLVVHNIK